MHRAVVANAIGKRVIAFKKVNAPAGFLIGFAVKIKTDVCQVPADGARRRKQQQPSFFNQQIRQIPDANPW